MRSFATVIALFASACAVWASPPRKLVARQDNNNDVTILNFALTLEHLEAEFYKQALEKFGEPDFRRANIPNPTQAVLNFHHILAHEAEHVATLQKVIKSLGGRPVPPCEYNFPLNNVKEFIRLAGVLEKVGVSAYNGAVSLLKNKDLQTAAATIDTIEARHASFLQTENGLDPFPASFDVALDGRQVVTLATPVIKACPFDLGFAPFGALKVDTSKPLMPGEQLKVEFKRESNAQHFCNFLFEDKSEVTQLSQSNSCEIPKEARGDVFLMVINSNKGVSLKDTNAIVAGPLVVDIDTAHGDSCQKFIGKDKETTVDSAKKGGEGGAKAEGAKVEGAKAEGAKAESTGEKKDATEAAAAGAPAKVESVVSGALPAEIQKQVEEVNRLKSAESAAGVTPPVAGKQATSEASTKVEQLQSGAAAATPGAAAPTSVAAAAPAAADLTAAPAAADPAAAAAPPADPAAAAAPPADPAAAAAPPADPAAAAAPPAEPAAAAAPPADPAAAAAAPPADPAAASAQPADPAASSVGAGTLGGPPAGLLGPPSPTPASDAPVLNMAGAKAQGAAVSADAIQL